MSQSTAPPDVKQLQEKDLPHAEFPGRGAVDFRIFLKPQVHKEIANHAAEDKSVEICGVLVGQWQRDKDGPFLAISASIRGEAAANKLAEVTFTHETWAKINKRMDTEFTDRSIVGWYHTHPDFGIFLSDRDRFIHESYFNTAGQVAYVVDPIRHEEGFFIWTDGKTTPCEHYWVGSQLKLAPPSESKKKERSASRKRESESDGDRGGEHAAGDSLQRDNAWILRSMMGLSLFLIGYLYSQRAGDLDRLRLQQGVVADYGIKKVLKPGLGDGLDSVNTALASVSEATRRLSAEQLKPSTRPAAEFQLAWDDIRLQIAQCQRRLQLIRDVYSVSPDEEALLQKVIIEATALAGRELREDPAPRTPAPAAPTTQAGPAAH